MRGNGGGDAGIGGGAEHQAPPGRVLRLEEGEEARMHREILGCQGPARGKLGLQYLLAGPQPTGQAQRQARVGAQHLKRRLVQRVDLQQRAVHVDAKRQGGRGITGGQGHLGSDPQRGGAYHRRPRPAIPGASMRQRHLRMRGDGRDVSLPRAVA